MMINTSCGHVSAVVLVGALLMLSGCGGGDEQNGGGGGGTTAISSGLSQATCGANPTVLLVTQTSQTALDATHGWVIYRAPNNPYFPATPPNIIDVFQGRRLASDTYSDDPYLTQYVTDAGFTYTYLGADGEQQATVTAAYNHYPMTPGTRYYYAIQRIIDPLQRAGYNPPNVTQQAFPLVSPRQAASPVTPELRVEVDSGQPLSEVSAHFGPVTFFTPPLQSSPYNGAPNQLVTNVRFTWQSVVGADTYNVELFGPNDPQGRRGPYWTSGHMQSGGGSTVMNSTYYVADAGAGLTPATTYYWRVGARAGGDAAYPSNRDLGKVGWLYSAMRSFTTSANPPTPLSAR
jgi:hypothetical protein